MSAIVDFGSFIWSILSSIVSKIISVVNFVKNLILFMPNFLKFLPTEISLLLLSALGIIVVVFIFKFIKWQ